MGEFITIIFGTAAPAPGAVPFDNSLIIGDGSAHLAESKMYALTSTLWQSVLEADGFSSSDQLYNSVADFFSASPTPQDCFAYAYVTGSEIEHLDVPLVKVTGTVWETIIKPPEGFGPGGTGVEQVKFYECEGGTGYEINKADGSVGLAFTVVKDGLGNWTGELEFGNGLTGQSGITLEDDLFATCKITVDFTAGTKGGIGQAIAEYKINMCCLALENDETKKNHSDNVFGTGQVDDLMTMLNAISGKNCIFFYALPGDANPEDSITGATNLWGELRSLVGQREDFVGFKTKPSSLNDDMAAGFMGMTSATHPHITMCFAPPHMGIKEQEPIINQIKWKDAKINYIRKAVELSGEPYQVLRGFTFGTDVNSERINAVRCKYIIVQTLRNGLYSLLSSRTVRLSYNGMQRVKAQIEAIFATLKDQGIVDGLVYVKIPVEQDFLANNAAGKLARQKREIPAIEIGYLWETSLEELNITALVNEAV